MEPSQNRLRYTYNQKNQASIYLPHVFGMGNQLLLEGVING
jgi:hypothetical protein